MEQKIDNLQKYANYKEQMGRLKRAMEQRFYLEAVFIEYAIMEDRLESALRHSGKWDPKPGRFVSIETKIKKLAKAAEEKKNPAHKYFAPELTDALLNWKEQRNRMIHALMAQKLHTEDLLTLAEDGRTLIKTLSSKTKSYNRKMEQLTE